MGYDHSLPLPPTWKPLSGRDTEKALVKEIRGLQAENAELGRGLEEAKGVVGSSAPVAGDLCHLEKAFIHPLCAGVFVFLGSGRIPSFMWLVSKGI